MAWGLAPAKALEPGSAQVAGPVEELAKGRVQAGLAREFVTSLRPQGSRRSSAPNCSIESYVCYESTSHPPHLSGNDCPMTGPPKSCDADGIASGGPSSTRQPEPAMSDGGRSARLRKDVVRCRQLRGDGGLRAGASECDRQQQGRCLDRQRRSRQLDQRADRAMIVVGIVGTGRPLG